MAAGGSRGSARHGRLLLALCCGALQPLGGSGQELYSPVYGNGLLAEYFSPLPSRHCTPGNGSTTAFDGLPANLTRTDAGLDFKTAADFDISRCAWEWHTVNDINYACRGADAISQQFAARWTGYLQITTPGNYRFELSVVGGGRVVIGHGVADITYGSRTEVLNARQRDMSPTLMKNGTFAKMCPLCVGGTYKDCWVTSNGCEPFLLWLLEADGGLSDTCGVGANMSYATRYLAAGYHPLRVEYFMRGGGDPLMRLLYRGPDTSGRLRPIPNGNLFPPQSQGLVAEWFLLPTPLTSLPPAGLRGALPPGAVLLKTQDDLMAKLGPGEGQFSLDAGRMTILVRWHGFLTIRKGGRYLLTLSSKDGSRLVMGGRGVVSERVVVDNDGLKEEFTTAEAYTDLLPGTHPIRVEFFSSPTLHDGSSSVLIRPQGVQLLYQGPDTDDKAVNLFSDVGSTALVENDLQCPVQNWEWSGGSFINRDCAGKCFIGSESSLGDKVCDDGTTQKVLSLTCPQFNADNNDCVSDPNFVTVTTPKPPLYCLESCPAGVWQRKGCNTCNRTSGKYCLADKEKMCNATALGNPWACHFSSCCVAKITNVDYWGTDCIAFGSRTNCTDGMERLLEQVRETPPSYATIAALPEGKVWVSNPVGELLEDCKSSQCNEITKEPIINPFTLLPTNDLICPVGESTTVGIECLVGPWEVTGVQNPFKECQGGKYQWNFCRNRKTIDGRPFTKCCAGSYVNYKKQVDCLFWGIESGTCDGYLQALMQRQLATFPLTAISMPAVLNECEGDRCNDPMNKLQGCPDVVVKHPAATAGAEGEDVDVQGLIATAPTENKAAAADLMNLLYIVLGIVGGFVLCAIVGFCAYRQYTKEPDVSLWHSQDAKVLADDCWVDTVEDRDGKFSVVKPKPWAFRALAAKDKVKPAAFCLPLDDVAPEAAWGSLEALAAKKGMTVEQMRQADLAELTTPPIAWVGSQTFKLMDEVSSEQRKLPKWRQATDHSTQLALSEVPADTLTLDTLSEVEVRQLALEQHPAPTRDPAAGRAPPDSGHQVALPSQLMLEDGGSFREESPHAQRTPQVAFSAAVVGRPPAAARMLRQGTGGIPRIAT